jgi:hypothetical protein
VYFLLRSGKSPAYFSLLDFVDNYSIELLYITVLFTLLSGWIIIPALAGYVLIAGALAWLGRQLVSTIRYMGIPIFKALGNEERRKRVSISIAEDYARSNSNDALLDRIEDYKKSSTQSLENEAQASANFILILIIAYVSHSTGAPSFIMKVTSFVDPYFGGSAYQICLALLIGQGLLGRASNFHHLPASGHLPTRFFKNEEERSTVDAWSQQVIQRHAPLAEKWSGKI